MLPSPCLTVWREGEIERTCRVVVEDELVRSAASTLATSGICVPRASFEGHACQDMFRFSKPGREREMAKKWLVGAFG